MGKQATGTLQFALLGLIHQAPKSGYDIRKFFETSPMKMFSPSPGSIYPALHRLRDLGMLEIVNDESGSGRRKELFRITNAGLDELKIWLKFSISRDDVIWSLDELLLKFAFIEDVLSVDDAIKFLESFKVEISSYLLYLEDYFEMITSNSTLCGRLAFECGIDGYRAHKSWIEHALIQLQDSLNEAKREI